VAAYADRTDLYRLGIREDALGDTSTDDQDAALEAASRTADSYLASQLTVPLTGTITLDVKSAVCRLAAYDLISGTRGFNPESDPSLRDRYSDALRWLEGVSKGLIRPQVAPSEAVGEDLSDPVVVSNCPRGW